MFKDKKMRKVVEEHLKMTKELLSHAEQNGCVEAVKAHTAQIVTIEHILRDFDQL